MAVAAACRSCWRWWWWWWWCFLGGLVRLLQNNRGCLHASLQDVTAPHHTIRTDKSIKGCSATTTGCLHASLQDVTAQRQGAERGRASKSTGTGTGSCREAEKAHRQGLAWFPTVFTTPPCGVPMRVVWRHSVQVVYTAVWCQCV